jgi:dienelactone hydrolase
MKASVIRVLELVTFVALCPSLDHVALAVPVTGANGRVVDFVGIKSAGPGGLKVQVTASGELIEVSWDKFDLVRLRAEQPLVFTAYEDSKAGKETELNLGSFGPTSSASVPANAPIPMNSEDFQKAPGRFFTSVGDTRFALQMPDQAAPRAILLLAIGQDGRSVKYLGPHVGSQWTEMANKLKLAVLVYDYPVAGDRRTVGAEKFAPFIEADKGSGEVVFKALQAFAKDTGKAEVASVPIAIYGQDVIGAAFAFNFTQAFPDRVLAAVVAKGASYSVKPTEASVKVPVMILSGEYDEDVKMGNPTNTHREIYEANLGMKPNWVYAVEFRASSGMTPASHHAAMTFLDRMILARLSPEGKLQDIDPERAFIGDLKESKFSRREDANAILTPDQTWLPDGEIAQMWKDLYDGNLKIPGPVGGPAPK